MVMIIHQTHIIYTDSITLYIQSYDSMNRIREGESLTYGAQLPFFNDKKTRKEFENTSLKNEWIIARDKSIINKLNHVQWWIVAFILLPVVIPVLTFLWFHEKYKEKKGVN